MPSLIYDPDSNFHYPPMNNSSFSARKYAWKGFLIDNPQLTPQTLDQIATTYHLDDGTIFVTTCSVGNITYLEHLAERINPTKFEEVIAEDDFNAFRNAAVNGHLDVLRYLEDKAPGQLQAMIAAREFRAFQKAASEGHIDVMRYLEDKAPGQLQAMIAADDFRSFNDAAFNGHLDVLRYLEDKAPGQLQAMIAAEDFGPFGNAAVNGHLDVMRYLEGKAPHQLQAMIAANDFRTLRNAARNGHLDVMRYLEDKAPKQLQAMITANDFEAFRNAARNGNLDVMRYLEDKAPGQWQAIITANNFDDNDGKDNFNVFRTAALKGYLHVMLYLEEQAPGQLQALIAANDFDVFRKAGNLDVMRYLENKAPEHLQAMITANDFEAFRNAAIEGNLDVMRYLEDKAPEQLQAMITADYFDAFFQASLKDHPDVLLYLVDKAQGQLQAMIASNDFYAFTNAADNGQLEVIRKLEDKTPELLQDMIAERDFAAFRSAASNGHLDVMRYLEEKAPGLLQDMIAANNFDAFVKATSNGHQDVINHLLHHASVLAYADSHVWESGIHVLPFIKAQLLNLQTEKRHFEEQDANAVFDLDEAGSKHAFYMLRHLIRRNDPELLDSMRFLLSIPGVKNLAHREVTPRESNELLRLALSSNNTEAVQLLLTLPDVHALAQRNNFYRQEQLGALDLTALARNRESSMTALSTGEQRRLKAALDHYNPVLQEEGMVPSLMTALKDSLRERYNEHPASIEVERNAVKTQIELPMDWEDFVALDLSPEERQMAKKAYYQHKDHTTWRYLSKPNPWMHEHASYVYISEDRTQRWSTFEDYQPLIALFFLGASDETINPIDDFSFETRLEHFINELALIGRAHNWDDARFIMDDAGTPLLDDEGNPRTEEYDNLEDDRPSCYSGVKRRLFQSLQGHPLFKMLTKELIETELRSFVRQHFESSIVQNNPEKLQAAWNDLVVEGNQEAIGSLKVLDISTEQQKDFLKFLDTKYGLQFSEEPDFINYVNKAFQLLKPESDCHVVYFAQRVDFPGLLQKAVEQTPNQAENPYVLFRMPKKEKVQEAEVKDENTLKK